MCAIAILFGSKSIREAEREELIATPAVKEKLLHAYSNELYWLKLETHTQTQAFTKLLRPRNYPQRSAKLGLCFYVRACVCGACTVQCEFLHILFELQATKNMVVKL